MKSPAERGRIGAWAYEARQDADLSVEEVQERLLRAGHQVTTATLRGVESGSKQPSRRLLRALATVYGKAVPGEQIPTETPDPLVTALQAQTLALTALVDELRQWRSEDRVKLAAVERTAEQLVARLLPVSEDGGSLERHVHGRTTE